MTNLPPSEEKTDWLSHPYFRELFDPMLRKELLRLMYLLHQAASESTDPRVVRAHEAMASVFAFCNSLGMKPHKMLEEIHGRKDG